MGGQHTTVRCQDGCNVIEVMVPFLHRSGCNSTCNQIPDLPDRAKAASGYKCPRGEGRCAIMLHRCRWPSIVVLNLLWGDLKVPHIFLACCYPRSPGCNICRKPTAFFPFVHSWLVDLTCLFWCTRGLKKHTGFHGYLHQTDCHHIQSVTWILRDSGSFAGSPPDSDVVISATFSEVPESPVS